MTSADHKKSALRRLLPILKLAIAGAMIAFVLWLVPIKDFLFLPGATADADRSLHGRIVERSDSQVLFDHDGNTIIVLLEPAKDSKDERIISVEFPSGDVMVPPADVDELRRARVEVGVITIARNADISMLLLAVLLVFVGSMVAVYRWYLLLLGAGLASGFRRAFSLTFIGLFFNNIMPGLTGGDVVKAVYIAREHRHSKTEAILTVLLDRLLGITGLALVAGLIIPISFSQYSEVAPFIYGFLGIEVSLGCLFFSRRIRSKLRLDSLVRMLPVYDLLRKIDQAVFLYRSRLRLVVISLLLSMCVHLIIMTGIGVMGTGIGFDLSFVSYYAVIPICLIVMALPMTPAGWGVGEAAFIYFLGPLGIGSSMALALALVYRMSQLTVSLNGGICLALEKNRVSSAEVERFTESDEDSGIQNKADSAM